MLYLSLIDTKILTDHDMIADISDKIIQLLGDVEIKNTIKYEQSSMETSYSWV